jgi:hypothetical protein
MKKLLYSLPLVAAAILAGCKADTIRPGNQMTLAGRHVSSLAGAVNTDFYSSAGGGTCSNVNSNIYPSQFQVGLNGSPSGLTDGSYYVQVQTPDGAVLGTSKTANFVANSGACYQVWALVNKQSDNSQGFDATTNPGGEYRLLISPDNSFIPDNSKSDNFKVEDYTVTDCTLDQSCPTPDALFTVQKFYDANANGVQDFGEPFIDVATATGVTPFDGWHVSLTLGDGAANERVTTYTENVFAGTSYSVTELMPSTGTWVPTTPPLTRTGVVNANGTTETFGNVCIGAGHGLTLGFWSNKNGQTATTAGDVTMLANLNLFQNTTSGKVTTYGVAFNPTLKTQIPPFLLAATATNMAYMLSAQLTAMELNVAHAGVSGLTGSEIVYVPSLVGSVLAPTGFLTINQLMAAANADLGIAGHNNTVAAGAVRTYQEILKTALDRANNGLGYVQSGPCSLLGATWSSWPTV